MGNFKSHQENHAQQEQKSTKEEYGRSHSQSVSVPDQNVKQDEDDKTNCIGEYIGCEKIGEGQFGTVHKGMHRTTKEVVAIKMLQKADLREAETLKRAVHKNIVRFIDIVRDSVITCIILEFCEFGSLDNYLDTEQPDKRERIKLVTDMSAGLSYLHGIPIIHRDIKPANILVDKYRVAKIADFGLAKLVAEPGSTEDIAKIYMQSPRGTIAYMAPEIMDGHYNLQADVFSLGLVFCGTLSEEVGKGTQHKCIGIKMYGNPDFRYTVPSNLDGMIGKLISSMLERDYHSRPKACDVHKELLSFDVQESSKQSTMETLNSRQLINNQVVHGYKILERVGTGTFADVYKAVDTSSKNQIALKRFKETKLDVGDVLIEIESLKIATHKNVVRYIASFNDRNTMYLVMEYCEFGTIECFIKEKRPDETGRMGFIQDIAAGIAHLHGLKIVHRDLKPANILVNSKCVAKLTDFGLAKIFTNAEGANKIEQMYMDTLAGTLVYMAPEVSNGHYNAQADIFSMGIVFCGIIDDELKEQIENELIGLKLHMVQDYSYTVPTKIGTFMQRLITKMLQKDYHLRPKAHEVTKQLMQYGKKSEKIDLKSIELLAAGISSCLGVIVLPPGGASSLKSPQQIKKITLHDLFHFTKPVVISQDKSGDNAVSSARNIVRDASEIDIMFKGVGGSSGKVKISKNASVTEMRRLMSSQSGIPEEFLEMIYNKWAIGEDQSIDKEGIGQGSVVHLHSVKEDQKGLVYYEMDEGLLAPQFNYDFTNVDDGNKQFIRGGHEYHRPCGWFRHALKVKGQYENDAWLGGDGIRTHSTPNEWPVSYHGSKMTSENIPLATTAGSGIITTPSLPLVAQTFVESFEFEGNTYQMALQNRINPDEASGNMVILTADYWLSPKEDPSKKDYDVRPYGILIRKI